MAKGKKTGGRKAGTPNKGFRQELDAIKTCLPAAIPPNPIIDADERDAAEQINDIMQHAGQVARAFRELMKDPDAPPQKTMDDYLMWVNVVRAVAPLSASDLSLDRGARQGDRGASHTIHRRSRRTAGADCGRRNHCAAGGCRCAEYRRDAAVGARRQRRRRDQLGGE
jgi:hypothetical protein